VRVNLKVLVIGALFVVPLLVLLKTGFKFDPTIVESPLIGKPAPTFKLSDLDGRSFDFEELKGRPMVVNFWATYCVPCIYEHPLLVEAAQFYQGRVHFLGVIYQDNPALIRQFNAQYGVWGPSLVDDGGRMAIAYGVYGPPETFFINRDGVIVHKVIGQVDGETLVGVVEEMLS